MSEVKQLIINNRRAFYDYFIEEEIEAGLVLVGTEVKSLRDNKVSMADAHVVNIKGELYLHGVSIPEYKQGGNISNHTPNRQRKLLLHSRQIRKMIGLIERKGMTVVPLQLYFNHKNIAKATIALARGKKQHDKRETIKKRDLDRRIGRGTKGEV